MRLFRPCREGDHEDCSVFAPATPEEYGEGLDGWYCTCPCHKFDDEDDPDCMEASYYGG